MTDMPVVGQKVTVVQLTSALKKDFGPRIGMRGTVERYYNDYGEMMVYLQWNEDTPEFPCGNRNGPWKWTMFRTSGIDYLKAIRDVVGG